MLINRQLLKIKLDSQPYSSITASEFRSAWMEKGYSEEESRYFIFGGEIANSAYNNSEEKINILLKSGQVIDIREASDQMRLSVLSESTRKYFFCYPKELGKAK
jgi:hypothetical protein